MVSLGGPRPGGWGVGVVMAGPTYPELHKPSPRPAEQKAIWEHKPKIQARTFWGPTGHSHRPVFRSLAQSWGPSSLQTQSFFRTLPWPPATPEGWDLAGPMGSGRQQGPRGRGRPLLFQPQASSRAPSTLLHLCSPLPP